MNGVHFEEFGLTTRLASPFSRQKTDYLIMRKVMALSYLKTSQHGLCYGRGMFPSAGRKCFKHESVFVVVNWSCKNTQDFLACG